MLFFVTPVQSARAILWRLSAVSLVARSKLRKWALPGQGGHVATVSSGTLAITSRHWCFCVWRSRGEKAASHPPTLWIYGFMDHLFTTAWRLSWRLWHVFRWTVAQHVMPSNFPKITRLGLRNVFPSTRPYAVNDIICFISYHSSLESAASLEPAWTSLKNKYTFCFCKWVKKKKSTMYKFVFIEKTWARLHAKCYFACRAHASGKIALSS